MPEQPTAVSPDRAWLVSRSGAIAAVRYELGEGPVRIGRGPQNDVVIQGADVGSVSLQHLEIRREEGGFRIRDLGSTNGTYLNGERIAEGDLRAPATIRLGSQGPELAFVLEEPASADLNKTLIIQENPASPAKQSGAYEDLLSSAVSRARHARSRGVGDQTLTIMRETLAAALRHRSRHLHLAIVALAAGLVAITGAAGWKIAAMNREKRSIDQRIHDIEKQLQKAAGPAESDRLVSQLAAYQSQAQQLENNVLYRIGPHEREDFLTQEIRGLMAEFGAEVYSVPPEFKDRVAHYIAQYQGPNRPLVARALDTDKTQLGTMRRILADEQLPPDLAYIPLVESALAPEQASAAGARGPWQFTAATAKANGLRVDGETDERLSLVKSTHAACRYLRNLILDFGAGSSVMLALAAYDLGPTKVKQAVMKSVRDPIKQRNFWYLYRMKALPEETREYVPKVAAAMIIGRNPQHFGF